MNRSNRGKSVLLALALPLAVVLPLPVDARGDIMFHVAVTGNDSHEGTEQMPFATIERAQQAVREKVSNGLSANVKVRIHGGVYELSRPLVFTPQDSGTEQFSVTYEAVEGETVLVSAGSRITGWTEGTGGIWTVELPEVKEGKWYFRNLFVNDCRAIRARTPNQNDKTPYLRLTGTSLSPDKQTWAMTLASGQVAPWKNLADVELVIVGPWEIHRKLIQSVNPQTATLVLKPPYVSCDQRLVPKPGWFCYLENARAFLDQPGEWYLDRASGTLSYWPRPGEDMRQARVIAPRFTSLMTIVGTAKHPVKNLHFAGLTFAHTDAALPPDGYIGHGQGHTETPQGTRHQLDTAIRWEFAHSCSIEDGTIAHIGGNGLNIANQCRSNTIQRCQFYDIGANGVLVKSRNTTDSQIPANWPESIQIQNCMIHDCGSVYHSGVGILAGPARNIRIAHNLIYDLPHIGVSINGPPKPFPGGVGSGYDIAHNHIHDVQKVLVDGAGVYVVGIQSNGVVRNNVIHNLNKSPISYYNELNGIYFDDYSTGYRVESNIVYNVAGKPLQFVRSKPESFVIQNNFWYGVDRFEKHAAQIALSFATNYFLDFPHQASLEPPQFTLTAQVNLTNIPSGQDPSAWIASKNVNELTGGHYALLISRNNAGAYLNIGGGRENCYAAWSHSGPLTTNVWHLLTMTYNGAELKVYCDGKLHASTPVHRQRSTGTGTFRIGKRADNYNPSFPGFIQSVRLYRRALSEEEIRDQVKETFPPLRPSDVSFDWNAGDIYAQMEKILLTAGPENSGRHHWFVRENETAQKK